MGATRALCAAWHCQYCSDLLAWRPYWRQNCWRVGGSGLGDILLVFTFTIRKKPACMRSSRFPRRYTQPRRSFLKSPTCARAAVLAVCGLSLVYSHPFGTLNWLAIAIGMSAYILLTSDLSRRALFPWVIANVAIAIGFLPWALILLQRARGIGDFWAPYPSPDVVYGELYLLVGGRLVAIALLIGAAVALRSNFPASIVLLFWAVVPVGLTLTNFGLDSHLWLPLFHRLASGASHARRPRPCSSFEPP